MLATHTNPCMADGRKRQQRKEKGSLTEAMALAVSSGEKKFTFVGLYILKITSYLIQPIPISVV